MDRNRDGGPRPVLAVLLAGMVVLGTLVVLGFSPPPGVSEAEPAPVADLAGQVPAPVEVVNRFHAALTAGDAAAAAALVAPGAEPLALPGLPFRYVPAGVGPGELADALAFFAEAMDVRFADCTLDLRTLTADRVACDVRLDSELARAGRMSDVAIPTMYTVADGAIVGVLRGPTGSPYFDRYCHWVERTVGLEAGQLFDADCRPLPTPGAAEAHRRLAAEFEEVGRPSSYRGYRQSRTGVAVVAILEAAHNQGRDAASLTYREESAAGFPGLVGDGRAPTLSEFLGWSSVVYRFDRGTCSVDATGPRLTLVCPAATWAGPLVEDLMLPPVTQPVTFEVRGATVAAVGGGTEPGLAHAFASFCGWVRETRPEVVSHLFEDGCRPIYTPEAARKLLVVVSGYTAGPR